MKVIIQKFGGTSVASQDAREHMKKRVLDAVNSGNRPVVVVSALGRDGDPYATDTLRSLALAIDPDTPLRELDLLMSCGEIISAVVTAATLNKGGLKTRVFTGGQAGLVCDGNYGNAEVVDCSPDKLLDSLEQGEVPVVAGFQGQTAGGEINTLGRGGSDTTAVILGAALKAVHVEIHTDVNGIMTADPRVVSSARLIDSLSYGEVAQLAYEGAKVIHPRAVEIAMQNGVNVFVKSPRDEGRGTLITSITKLNNQLTSKSMRVVTGIAFTSNLAQVSVELPSPDSRVELELFEKMAEAGVNVDLINVFPLLKVFTVKKEDLPRARKVLDLIGVTYRLEEDCAKVSVVGAGMTNIPGVMARVVRALGDSQVEILQTSDSNITISILVRQVDLNKAILTLHNYFELEKDDISNRHYVDKMS